MRVLLVPSNPHPIPGAREDIYADWWGREIEIGGPRFAEEKHNCGTHTVWLITGPVEFVELLNKHNLGRYVCVHLIGEVLESAA